MKIEKLVTSGKFRLDGGEWDVDNNVYILGGKGGVYIIDPAHNAEEVIDAVGDRPVRGIILTHAHNDHCELAPQPSEHYGVEVHLHPEDDTLCKESTGDAAYVPLADSQQFQLDVETIPAFHTPGHSPGCVAHHLPQDNVLRSGDT